MSEWLCYTDGASKAGDAGGWGFHLRPRAGSPIEGHGSVVGAIAKTMEYRAVAEAVDALPPGVAALVFSDNLALVENLSRRLDHWRQNGFAKVDPLIVDSVRRLDAAIVAKNLRVRFQWVRGHNGNAGNERADALAAEGARAAKLALTRRGAP